jgi:hypothetical protein
MNGIQGLDDMQSKSVPQLSSIELLFKPGTDLLQAAAGAGTGGVVSPSLPPGQRARHAGAGLGRRACHADRHDVKDHSLIEMSMTAY